MIIDLLLTSKIKATMPDTIKINFNFGKIGVIFPSKKANEVDMIMYGDSVVIEGDKEEIIKWLKPFDGIAVGCGTPQLEKFTIMHINENL
jgi:hypothetical protein